jgi:hypothetical protein
MRRLRFYRSSTTDELRAVWAMAHKLACVAQSLGERGEGGERAVMKQLRRLKQEAAEAVAGVGG